MMMMMMMQDMQGDESATQLEAQLAWADAVLLVFSVTDRSSFEFVVSLCHDRLSCHYGDNVSTPEQRHCADTCAAVVVVGNKADLQAGRCVGTEEATDKVVDAAYYLETSAMEGGPEIASAFETLCRLVIGRRSSTVSPPGVLNPDYNSRQRPSRTDSCKRRFLRQQFVLVQAVDKLKRKLYRSVDCN